VQFGTISFGVFHITTGDIQERDAGGHLLSTFGYSRTQALVAYGKKLPYSLSAGATLKFDYQSLSDGTASGAGLDLGLLDSPDSDFPVLGDFTLGISLQNALTPSLKLNQIVDTLPRIVRIGIAKPVQLGQVGNAMNLLAGLRFSERADSRFNFGAEYAFRGQAMIRAGFDGNAPSFGGGYRYQSYTIDYALSRVSDASDVAGMQHRISVTIDFGKTKSERIEIARQLQIQQIEEQTAKRVSLRQKLDFEDFMNKGKAYYQQEDFFIAMIRFASAREIFPNDPDANAWYDRARQKVEQLQQQEVAQEVAEAEEASRQQFVQQQYQKGMQFLEAKKYSEAIIEWQRALELDPENELLKSIIAKTENEIIDQVSETLQRARAAESRNNITVALEFYDLAIRQGLKDDAERQAIEAKIAGLRKQLTFNDMFRQGLTDYIEKNYAAAMKGFQEALKIVPKDRRVQQYLDDAEARANARIVDFPDENFRRRFLEAVRLIQREDYEAALAILGELQKEQRYNKRILDAIDLARERQQKKQ
jgi:tetratricopeptide (TPR) repeat protein